VVEKQEVRDISGGSGESGGSGTTPDNMGPNDDQDSLEIIRENHVSVLPPSSSNSSISRVDGNIESSRCTDSIKTD
jgi:hypothetical protein